MIALILLFIIALLVYMAIALLVAGIAGLAVCDSSGELSQKDRDISTILGALWPVSLPYMCFMTVIYYPLVATIKAAKRLIKGDY